MEEFAEKLPAMQDIMGSISQMNGPSQKSFSSQLERISSGAEEYTQEEYQEYPDHCRLSTHLTKECGDSCEKYHKHEIPESDSTTSGVRIARKIMEDVFKQATKEKHTIRVKKRLQMKSGWMDLSKKINNFHIDDDTFKNIMFEENLLVSVIESGQNLPVPVGALSLNIQAGRGGPFKNQNKKIDYLTPKFLVHLSSQLDFFGNNGGSRITAWVDRELQTLEEKRREYIKLDEGLDQQVLYVSSQENFYYLRHDKNKDIFYSPQKAKNLICEGANFVLMRYLAITRYVGNFELSTLYIEGGLCRNIYECKGPSSGIVNDKKIDVCKIYRTIIEESGIQHKSVTLMTLDGQILKQEWLYCNYILQINPLIDVMYGKPRQRIPLEDQSYKDDLQLLSLFLNKKTESKKIIQNYMEDHPEIKNMLSDYLQTILQLKPEDVFEFTAKYFLAFTPALLPQSEYFEGPFNVEDDEDYEFWKYI